MASLINVKRIRFPIKPVESFTSIGIFLSFMHRDFMVCRVSEDVFSPLIISTGFITCGGLKKCIPINLSDLLVLLESRVIDNVEVLLANMHSFLHILSNLLKISFFSSIFSIIASTIKSHSLILMISVVKTILFIMLFLSSSVIVFFSRNLSRLQDIFLAASSICFF